MFWERKKPEPTPAPCSEVKINCGVHHIPHVNMRAGTYELTYEKNRYGGQTYIRISHDTPIYSIISDSVYAHSLEEVRCLIKLLQAALPELETAGVV